MALNSLRFLNKNIQQVVIGSLIYALFTKPKQNALCVFPNLLIDELLLKHTVSKSCCRNCFSLRNSSYLNLALTVSKNFNALRHTDSNEFLHCSNIALIFQQRESLGKEVVQKKAFFEQRSMDMPCVPQPIVRLR